MAKKNHQPTRVNVAISLENQRLREMQSHLNYFLWTSEIAYGYAIESATTQFPDVTMLASDAFSSVTTAAWYPTNQGKLKYRDTVGTLLDHVRHNTVHVYRAVITFFASAFESYLEARFHTAHLNRRGRSWGPYVSSLAIPELISAPYPVELRAVLCADICRRIRNCMVHPPFQIPTNVHDPAVHDWRRSLFSAARSGGWPEAETDAELNSALNWAFSRVIREAHSQVVRARTARKDLPIELFYTLFNFTNLDTLGFQIEEALIPLGTILQGRGERRRDFVRRHDLILTNGT